MRTARRRGTALATMTATSGLLLAAATAGTAPAVSAEPAGDCTAAYPISELAQGESVTGLTVVRGTTPEPFTGEVLGVLEDGIAPGLDMVMVDVEMPAFADFDKTGIWSGMSGSPVYAPDGRLIGAIAYGLGYGPSPVAGVTPFEDMDEHLAAAAAAPAGRVAIDAEMAGRIAAATDVTRADARQGLRPLPLPIGVSGVRAERLEPTRERAYLPQGVRSAAGGAAAPVGPETIVPGGNLAASLSYGDVTQAGVGTATSICDGRVVGFGHPMSFEGRTTMTLHPASAIYVHADGVYPGFKVTNLGAPAGTISQDRRTGIAGAFGAPPRTAEISSTVTYEGRSRTGTTHNSVDSAAAGTTYYQIVANHDRVIDATMPGSETMAWSVEGTDVDGSAFEVAFTDRYVSDWDVSSDSAYDVADMVYALSSLAGVDIDAVTAESTVSEDSSSYRVSGLQQKRRGRYVAVGRDKAAVVKAGSMLRMRVLLTGPSGSSYVPVKVRVPETAAGMKGQLQVQGGNWVWTNQTVTSVAKAKRMVATMVRNDEVQAELFLTKRRTTVRAKAVSTPADKVVSGQRRVRVLVR